MNASLASRVRDVIAVHFRIERDRLVDEVRLRDDLGADWLDRLELLIAIEDQVAEFTFDNMVAEQIETIGDLMRAIEDADGSDYKLKRNTPLATERVSR
jgi:acyl carrier protein